MHPDVNRAVYGCNGEAIHFGASVLSDFVNNTAYKSSNLPVLNYEGNTYIPLKAIGELLGGTVNWNDHLNRAEIYYGAVEPAENSAFRNIKVSGSNDTLSIELFEYSAKDGSKINIITKSLESFKP